MPSPSDDGVGNLVIYSSMLDDDGVGNLVDVEG
jgi:hypothetical protein